MFKAHGSLQREWHHLADIICVLPFQIDKHEFTLINPPEQPANTPDIY